MHRKVGTYFAFLSGLAGRAGLVVKAVAEPHALQTDSQPLFYLHFLEKLQWTTWTNNFMTALSEETLIAYNKIGLIPGPGEDAEAFGQRVDYSLHLTARLPEELKSHLKDDLQPKEDQSNEILQQAAANLKNRYDCAPDWTPLFFSDYKLPFWQGGCAWIFQMEENTPTSALIQLRKNFKHSPRYLGIYHRNELLTHELSHCGRMMFQEPKFEEILAYRTSNSSFRRSFGALLQSSKESALIMLLLFMLIVFDVFLIALGRPDAYYLAFWLKLIPIALLAGSLIRLGKRQKNLDRCLENLEACVGNDKAHAVVYRLQDREILLFSKFTKQEIVEYAMHRKEEELRWKVIFKAYFI